MRRKHRQCPYCKSKKGFRYEYSIGGYGFEVRDFYGVVHGAEREMVDDIDEHTVRCLNCDAKLDQTKLEI